ncbi:MAG: AAA family ATPase [Spirosomataceae bacterium]
MKKIKIVVGLSGSGKSTWAKEFCKNNPEWLRINRDDIRKSMLMVSLNEYHQWETAAKYRIEKLVTEQHNQLMINALRDNWHVVLDNTHLKQSYINEYKKLLIENFESFEISYQLMDVPLDICLENDKKREDVVGETVIREQLQKLHSLKKLLSFKTETYTRERFLATQNEDLPRCVLVDIDGTVAQMQGRYPFDWNRVGEDLPKQNIIRLVKALKENGNQIIFFSGRDEVCRNITREWLCEYFQWKLSDFQLFMRKSNDQRKDSDVKFDLYEEHIRNKYFVELVIDDRQQVVDMWRRKLGLTCLQVDYGDF